MDEKTKQMIVNVINDVNIDNDEFFDYFKQNIKKKISVKYIKTIHKDYLMQIVKDYNFDKESFKIKGKDAKYYLVRGWTPTEVIEKFNKPVYDYRLLSDIIDDDVLLGLYKEISMNELAKKINVEYMRLVRYLKNKHSVNIRNVKDSNKPNVVDKRKKTMKEKYGYENPSSVPEFKEKRKQTNIERYGVDNVFKSAEIKDRIDNTNIERYGVKRFTQTVEYLKQVKEISQEKYGVEHYTQNEGVKSKTRKTCKTKYGVEYALQADEIRFRIKKTMKEKYGYENPSSVSEFKEKRKQTNIERYGTEYYIGSDDYWVKTLETNNEKYGTNYPMQNIDIFEKSMKNSYKRDEYIIDGVSYELQGYEPIVLTTLLEFFTHEEIISNSKMMPKIMYNYNGKIKRYVPDFYIPSLNLIIEVKSNYTYVVAEKKNIAKRDACIAQGINFEFIILERKEIEKNDRRIRDIGNRRVGD